MMLGNSDLDLAWKNEGRFLCACLEWGWHTTKESILCLMFSQPHLAFAQNLMLYLSNLSSQGTSQCFGSWRNLSVRAFHYSNRVEQGTNWSTVLFKISDMSKQGHNVPESSVHYKCAVSMRHLQLSTPNYNSSHSGICIFLVFSVCLRSFLLKK